MNRLIISNTFNPYINIAVETYLCENIGGNSLFLWQNDGTVVVGAAQNTYSECDVKKLKADKKLIARRFSGGGAVYHDKGNLNFSFICPKAEYSLEKNLSVIIKALKNSGINAEFSGRNDLLVFGKKFSGNAFRHGKDYSLHHGTILINGNLKELSRYLTPQQGKLESKGIKSVASRVVNLKELNNTLTVEKMKKGLASAYTDTFGETAELCFGPTAEKPEVKELYNLLSSEKHIFGENPPFSTEINARFSFGHVNIRFNIESGVIQNTAVFSDALNVDFINALAAAFKGAAFSPQKITSALENSALDSHPEYPEFLEKLSELF